MAWTSWDVYASMVNSSFYHTSSITDYTELQNPKVLSDSDLKSLTTYFNVSNFLSCSMIFLKYNTLLKQPLEKEHVKPRLLGHWGTCPAISLVHAHATLATKIYVSRDFFVVTGTGHGAPAVLATQCIDGTLEELWGEKGKVENVVKYFSTPQGFPSHTNSLIPSIVEGGELGYALSVAWGAVLDKPNDIAIALIGDGENETGASCTSWHAHKFIDHAESGCVLPILNCNGYKIASPTLYASMSDQELHDLFQGFGYNPYTVTWKRDDNQLHRDLYHTMQICINENIALQNYQRTNTAKPLFKPRVPMIILRTPKGWTGPRYLRNSLIEGTQLSHQVPLKYAKTDDDEFQALKSWLESYRPQELFDEEGNVAKELQDWLPLPSRRLSRHPAQYNNYKPLQLPDWTIHATSVGTKISPTVQLGKYLKDIIDSNRITFRIFSPDELESNKLHAVLETTTRNMQWNKENAHKRGRVTEVLSEHLCQGLLQGYTITGRHGLFPSYEAFLQIVSSMAIQCAKFLKFSLRAPWRGDMSPLTYLATSGWEIQHHNGASHAAVSFATDLMNMKAKEIRCYTPVDANVLLATYAHACKHPNRINLIMVSKLPCPIIFSPKQAKDIVLQGAMVHPDFTDDDPDVVIASAGCEVTSEALKAIQILQSNGVKVQFVNVNDLGSLEMGNENSLTAEMFQALFPPNVPCVFVTHTYPKLIESLLFTRPVCTDQFKVLGFIEEGTTTTPLRMMVLNGTSRWQIVLNAIDAIDTVQENLKGVKEEMHKRIYDHHMYVHENLEDPPDL